MIRPATQADAPAIADIYLAARAAALPGVRWTHGEADVRGWVAATLVPAGGVWVMQQGDPVGFMAVEGDFLAQLYLHPDHWRKGAGTALLNHAKTLNPTGLLLWCFQVNTRARAFYEAHGFVAQRLTDGADNEEHEPDILYAWQGAPAPSGVEAPRGA